MVPLFHCVEDNIVLLSRFGLRDSLVSLSFLEYIASDVRNNSFNFRSFFETVKANNGSISYIFREVFVKVFPILISKKAIVKEEIQINM